LEKQKEKEMHKNINVTKKKDWVRQRKNAVLFILFPVS
jgi:hypothetical protein